MLHDIDNFVSKKWSTLIGRPRLTLIGHRCRNVTCCKDNFFKKYQDNQYICQCGYEVAGDFMVEQHKVSLYCGVERCNINKTKMDVDCVKCQFIRERLK